MQLTWSRAQDPLLMRESLHGDDAPSWMEDVLATAIGPKIVAGECTEEVALQLLVGRKRPLAALAADHRIPARLDGIPTDVLRASGEMAMAPALVPAAAPEVGYGTPLVTSRGALGTAGFAAVDGDGDPVLLTAAHVVQAEDQVALRRPGIPIDLGRLKRRHVSALGGELYGERAKNPNERFAVDLVVLRLAPSLRVFGGLWGGHGFAVPADTADLLPWLVGAPALAFGAGTGGWRQGKVTSLWPRRRRARVTGFCAVQHAPRSTGGDSGSLWLARRGRRLVAIGCHWGLVRGYAFVTDLAATRALVGLGEILSQP